jgi:uncharacterized damage-inducible protein DinB
MTATSNASHALADGILHSADLLRRYLAGFDDTNATAQAPNLPNHVIWCLGHLAITMHRAAERISQKDMPLSWDPEPFAFGSQPVPDRNTYPPLSEINRRFDAAVSTLAEAVRSQDEAGLSRAIPWGKAQTTVRDMAMRMVFHNGTHTGQIVDLRRALGLPGVLR